MCERTSSRIVVTALTTDFIGVNTRVGAFERPAERSESMAVKKAVRCTSGMAPSAETGSWSSNLGFCRNSADVAFGLNVRTKPRVRVNAKYL